MAELVRAFLAVPATWLPDFESDGLQGLSRSADGLLAVHFDRQLAVNQARVASRTDPNGQGCVLAMTIDAADAEAWRGGDDEPNAPLDVLWVDPRGLAELEGVLAAPAELIGVYS